MKAEPNHENSYRNCQDCQTRQALLKPDQDQSDKSSQKREKHIHIRILAQDAYSSRKFRNQGLENGLLTMIRMHL